MSTNRVANQPSAKASVTRWLGRGVQVVLAVAEHLFGAEYYEHQHQSIQ